MHMTTLNFFCNVGVYDEYIFKQIDIWKRERVCICVKVIDREILNPFHLIRLATQLEPLGLKYQQLEQNAQTLQGFHLQPDHPRP